jgi:hypothetical protein
MLRHDHLRMATCLAHTIPGVTVELACCNDEHLIVAHHRLDADFSPCELRTAVLAGFEPGLPRFVDIVIDAAITTGLHHLGGGLYERDEERWFATFLGVDQLHEVLAASPVDLLDAAVDICLYPDSELGVSAVRIACDAARLDEIASWAVAACMVAELIPT